LRHEEPSAISSCENDFFIKAAGAVKGISSEIAIVPYLMVAGTDSIKFQDITKDTIRFTPYTIDTSDMKRIHGTNERISLENIGQCLGYYLALLKAM
jgi:carboxypeptidase PM20D1